MDKIRGIILRLVKYNDKKQIVDMYTSTRGRMSFIMPIKARLSPLSILEFDVEIHPNRNLQTVSSLAAISDHTFTQNLRLDPVKSIMAMFIVEFLSNALKEEAQNTPLYYYIEDSILWLDTAHDKYANFHLVFLMRILQFMGIQPNFDDKSSNSWFDLMEACYVRSQPFHRNYLNPDEAKTLPYLFHMDYSNMHLYGLSRRQRYRCLEVLNDYYCIHLPGFARLKSLEILKSVFDK